MFRLVFSSSKCRLINLREITSNSAEKILIWDSSLFQIIPKRSFAKLQPSKTVQNKVTPLGWFLLVVPATAFGLGCWQIKRKSWKENLIRELDLKTSASPVPLPDEYFFQILAYHKYFNYSLSLDEINKMEYLSVNVRGEFLHDKEIYMGPRSFMRHGDAASQSSLFSKQDSSIGFLVITPFQLSGRKETILVNRGWVPKSHLKPETRLQGQVKGEVDIIAVVRIGEARPQFTPDHKTGPYLYRDLSKMCAETGAFPIFLDAKYESTIPGGPIGGQTRVSLRNEHLSYIMTWFSLSLATSFMWYRQIIQRKAF